MKSLLRIAFVVFLLVWTFESESNAIPITVAFTGEIDSVTDPGGVLPGGIGIGTSFSGTYTFDSVGTPDLSFPPGFTSYLPNGSVSAVVGGNPFSSISPVGIILLNDQPGGPGNILGDGWLNSPVGCDCIEPGVFFGDTTGSKISDVTNYFVNTSLAEWDLHDFVLYTNDPNTGQNQEWASGALRIVPEPSIALLFGLGLAGLGWRGRVRHSWR
jgi:hypothetical protein